MKRSGAPGNPARLLVRDQLSTSQNAAEVERLISLGAERVDWDLYPEDPDFIVLADTEGNRFCVVDKSHGVAE